MKRHVLLKPVLSVSLVLSLGLLQFSMALAQPTNDDFDGATEVTLPFTDTINTTEATTAEDDPSPTCVETSSTVWYAFTPTATMTIDANTFGSDYDTILAVFTGTRGALTEIACNDDADSLQSKVVFEAEAGNTYYFMIGTFGFGDEPFERNLVFNVAESNVPALMIDLSINFAYVDPRTGEVTVGGVVTCPQIDDDSSSDFSVEVFIDIFLEQSVGRIFTIQGFSFMSIQDCVGETDWVSESFRASSGIFKPGKGRVTVSAFANSTDGQFAEDSVESTVRLSPRLSLDR